MHPRRWLRRTSRRSGRDTRSSCCPVTPPAERAEKNAAALKATLEIAERIDAKNGTGPQKSKPASDKDKVRHASC